MVVMKEYISEEKINIYRGYRHSILLTKSGKVYEYLMKGNERENSEKINSFWIEMLII